ncbi:MAG TPA: LytTR family DNA-binding domain-containing protein [Burkholderiaceae bacterium]|jgi:two-component system LytT family response regulator
MTINVLIVDDEPLARQRIRQLMAGEAGFDVVGEAGNGLEAVTLIETLHPDLVFLDIQMPELDGFGVIEAIGVDDMPPVLFITAYDAHALKAFDVHAMDYLLKPIDKDRFHHALARVRDKPQPAASDEGRLTSLITELTSARQKPDRIMVKTGERWVLVKTSNIQWIEAEEDYVRLRVEGASYLLRQTMSSILTRLDHTQFKRIHRSTIVNLDFVQEIHPWSKGDALVVMRDGTRLTLSRSYRNVFAEWR